MSTNEYRVSLRAGQDVLKLGTCDWYQFGCMKCSGRVTIDMPSAGHLSADFN